MKVCFFLFVLLVPLASISAVDAQMASLQYTSSFERIQDHQHRDGVANRLSYDLMREENTQAHRSRVFRGGSALHVRHGLDLHLALQPQEQCAKPFTFLLTEDTGTRSAAIFTWTQPPTFQHQGELHYHLHVNRSIPVGKYALHTSDPCSNLGKDVGLGDVFVMFNPHELESDSGRNIRQSAPRRDEYIDNNWGVLWRGPGATVWDYGVGSQAVTDSTNALIQLLTPEARSNTVLFTRGMSELVGNYVLQGRWDGQYYDGIEPTQWVGSADILARWLRNGQKVKYGQCWVFAGVLTTVLRASGIPARSVTNYDSHHDRGLTDDRREVLRQYDNIGQSDESIWNFHVWSEAWLARPDLNQPADWNAVDATPQEPSPLQPGQPFRAGPAYVPFIRADRRNTNYDTYFILAEVNALRVCPLTGELLPVGTNVWTKKPGRDRSVYTYYNPDDITNNYKIKSVSKRASNEDAAVNMSRPYKGCERDGGMRLSSVPPQPMVGEDFKLMVTEGNVSAADTFIRMELMNYMGESLGIIRNFTGTKEVNVAEMDYLQYLRNSSILRFTVGTFNESGSFEFHDDLRITLEYEPLEVATGGDSDSSTFTVTVTYTNPLSIPMTGVVASLCGPDHTYMRLDQPDIPANSPFTLTVEMQCGEEDGDVVVPVSLDSNDTQSAHGMGWYDCGSGSSSGASIATAPVMLAVMIMIIGSL